MLRNLHELVGYDIRAADGSIGHVKDFLFDDGAWVIRYLVADTGNWLPGRKVLLVPGALEQPVWENHAFPVRLTRQQVKDSPDISEDQPVSKQHEADLHRHYAWDPYWLTYTGYEGPMAVPASLMPGGGPEPATDADPGPQGDPHLRSAKEVEGYHVAASDGDIGHVEDFILDDDGWVLRYVVVDTRNWLPGRKVLVSPEWFDGVSWPDQKVFVEMDRESIRNSPPYDPDRPITRDDEQVLHDYHGRPAYWKEVAYKVATAGGG